MKPIHRSTSRTMHRIFALSAFGWLSLSGVMHFTVDVVSQHVRGKRVPGLETTFYYGMHTAYALGQVLFGILALWVIRQGLPFLSSWQTRVLCLVAFGAWAIFCFLFIEYREPKVVLGIYGGLLALALVSAPSEKGR